MSTAAEPACRESRAVLAVLAALALAGLALGWNRGQLPRREPAQAPVAAVPASEIAPDLALYRDVIADVKGGQSYYDSARRRIPQYGSPIASPLNWRLPTYAWLFSRLPGPDWIRSALVGLSFIGLALVFCSQWQTRGAGYAAVTTVLTLGVVRWAVDGHAYLAQEPWAATLLVISLAAHARDHQGPAWRGLAVFAGTAALLFRELALPYCAVACLLAAWNGRWREAGAWAIGIVAFFALLAWHIGQVKLQLASTDIAPSAGLGQWFRLGGLHFVLLTTRMNSLLFAAPAVVLWLYLLLALVGLSHGRDETSRLAGLAAAAYVLAYAVVGRPENFYWGLLPAPLLAWGLALSPGALGERWRAAHFTKNVRSLASISSAQA